MSVEPIIERLREVRSVWRAAQNRPRDIDGREFPSRDAVRQIVAGLCGALFPMRLGPPDLRQSNEDHFIRHTLDHVLHLLVLQARLERMHQTRLAGEPFVATAEAHRAIERVQAFADSLPGIRETLDADVIAAYRGDPAARSVDEVLLCYPGVQALIHHRLAHVLYQMELPLLARLVNELAHTDTGIDIHPGAQIGREFFIDHGTGVVIGETAVIGERVRLYQAVTLGARSFPAEQSGRLKKGLLRHPVVEDDVVIYAGATILGRVTIGRGSVIGGNVWITHDVPPGSQVAQASMRQQQNAGSALPDWADRSG